MPGMFESLFGYAFGKHAKKPVVPELPSLEDVLKTTTKANLETLPEATKLASGVNEAQLTEFMKGLEKVSPGLMDIWKKNTDVMKSYLEGQIPKDVSEQIARASAAQAMGGGYAGSGMGRNLTARDLGLTSLKLQSMGSDLLNRWSSFMTSLVPQFNISSMFSSPAQGMNWAENQWNKDWMQSQLAAMLSPKEQAFNQFVSSAGAVIDYTAKSFLDMYTMGGADSGAKIGDWNQTQMNYMDWLNGPEGSDFTANQVKSYADTGGNYEDFLTSYWK